LCYKAVKQVPYPVQAIWGVDDPFLKFKEKEEEIKKSAGLSKVHELSSYHFLQEEKPMEIVEKLRRLFCFIKIQWSP
jgi:hypothetical protein